MTPPITPSYAGHRFPPEVIGHAVWLYFRFPLSLRMVEEMLAARGVIVSHETVRQWGLKFGQGFANRIRRRLPRAGDKWPLDGSRRGCGWNWGRRSRRLVHRAMTGGGTPAETTPWTRIAPSGRPRRPRSPGGPG